MQIGASLLRSSLSESDRELSLRRRSVFISLIELVETLFSTEELFVFCGDFLGVDKEKI